MGRALLVISVSLFGSHALAAPCPTLSASFTEVIQVQPCTVSGSPTGTSNTTTDPSQPQASDPSEQDETIEVHLPDVDASCPPESSTCVEANSNVTDAELNQIAGQLDYLNQWGIWQDPSLVTSLNNAGMVTHEASGAALSQNYAINGHQICSCPRTSAGGGCFSPETEITMGDKSLKRVDQIAVGDNVWNPVLNLPVKVVRIIEGPEKNELIKIEGDGFSVVVTELHPMVTSAGLAQARAVTTSVRLKLPNGDFKPITNIERMAIYPNQRVINLELNGDTDEAHYLSAGGVVTGDNYLQSKLAHEVPEKK